MQEKTEWELIDEPMPQSRSQHSRSQEWAQSTADAPPHEQATPGPRLLLQAMLGRWWRWKIAGAALFTAFVVVMLAMLTGVFALVAAVGAVVALGVGKLRQWMRRHQGALTP